MAKKKVKYRQYDVKNLEMAYEQVLAENISASRAAQNFGVPVSTLKDSLNGKIPITVTVPGRQPMFSKSEEQDIVHHIQYMATIGYGYSRMDLRHIATDVAVYLGKMPDTKLLSDNWVTSFLRRWPNLKLCKPRSLEWIRARSANKVVIDKYYEELERTLKENRSS